MNKKIAIIGGGLFGSTIYITLKRKGYDCTLFERNNDLLLGASTNNLNRVHFGYHYPRDDQTAKQSYNGYVSFKKFYKGTIIKDFKNYYLIAENSKVNLKDYLKFCKRNQFKAGFNICYRHNDTAYLLPISSLMLMAIIDADRVLGFGKKQPAFNKNTCHVKQQSQPNAHG